MSRVGYNAKGVFRHLRCKAGVQSKRGQISCVWVSDAFTSKNSLSQPPTPWNGFGLYFLLLPKTSRSPPTPMAATPAQSGILTVFFSFAESSTGPILTTVVFLV